MILFCRLLLKKIFYWLNQTDKGHITVYLPSFNDAVVSKYLSPIKDFQFEVFSKEVKQQIKRE